MPRKKKEPLIDSKRKRAAEEQIDLMRKEVDYDIRDFTIDYIVQQFQEGLFFIPPYQREFIWKERNRCEFIESLILGLPIPFMFVADTEEGNLEIVDGAQRIQTLESFFNDDLELKKLTKLPLLNGFKYSDLPSPQQKKLKTKPLRMIVLEDTTSLDIRQEIFKRINRSAEKVRGPEVRRFALGGSFMEYIKGCTEHELFEKFRREGERTRCLL